jgi:beta-lactamase regulating signal transducer with metallopeptidase domain
MPGTAAAGMPGLVAGYFLRTAIVLTLALIAAAIARHRPAAFRHFLFSSALIGLLLLPFLGLAPVGWRSALVPRWMAPAIERASKPGIGTSSEVRRLSKAPDGPAAATRELPRLSERTLAEATPAEAATPAMNPDRRPDDPATASPAAGRTEASSNPAVGSAAAAESAGGGRRPVDLLIALFWSAGLAVLVLRLGIGLAGALRLTAEGRPLAGPAWRALLDRFLALVPLRRKVRLKSHPEVLVPLTWGWRRPVVLMPSGSDGWTEEERSSALFHELSHIKRADFIVMLLVRTSLAVFWWNPLCWVVYRELLKEQELACDELVLRAGIRPSSYAASLLAFRRSAGLRWNPSAALLGLLGRSSFQDRLAAILRQKLTYMEVKMKTKIMLAAALTLAVALVGMARPVPGNDISGVVTVLAETTMPAPASFEAAFPPAVSAGQEVAAAAQETKAEQEKAKAAEKAKRAEKAKEAEKAAQAKAAVAKTIVISPRGGEGKPIEVVITEGGETKTLVFEKPLTLTTSNDGRTFTLKLDGKEVEVLKGEPLRIEIKGGDLQVVKEPGLIKVGEGGVVTIVKEGGDEARQVVYYGHVKPEIVVETKPEVVVEAKPNVIVKMGKDVKPGETWVHVAPVEEGQAVKVVREARPGIAWTTKEGDKAFAVASTIHSGEMLEKIQALQEQVQAIKAKKMDLSALEESLKKLEAELRAKEEKLKELEVKFEKAPGEFTVVKRVGEGKAESNVGVWVMEKDKAAQSAKAKVMVGMNDKDGRTISLVFTGQEGEAGKAAFERAIASLKKELPDGYKIVEQEFDAEKGVMTFKISAPEGKKTDETLIRKLVELVQKDIKAGK